MLTYKQKPLYPAQHYKQKSHTYSHPNTPRSHTHLSPATTTHTPPTPQSMHYMATQHPKTTSLTPTITSTPHPPRRATNSNSPSNTPHPFTSPNDWQGLIRPHASNLKTDKCNKTILNKPDFCRTLETTAPPKNQQIACTHTTQSVINKPHATACTAATHASYVDSKKNL